MTGLGIVFALAATIAASTTTPRGIEVGVQAAYANFPREAIPEISHAFPYGLKFSYHDGQGTAYGLHAVRGPARIRHSCYSALDCNATWWEAGLDIKRAWTRNRWSLGVALDLHYSEASLRQRYPDALHIVYQSGVGLGAGAEVQYRWGRVAAGPFAKINLENSDIEAVALAGLQATYFLELSPRTEARGGAMPLAPTDASRAPWLAEARATIGAWGWRELLHLRLGYKARENFTVWFGGGWGTDAWLCSLRSVSQSSCSSDRIRAVAEVRHESIRGTFLALTGGLAYRRANSRERALRPKEKALRVFRSEYLVELAPAFHQHLLRSDLIAVSFGVEAAFLSSDGGGYPNRRYFFETYALIAEPRAVLSVVLL